MGKHSTLLRSLRFTAFAAFTFGIGTVALDVFMDPGPAISEPQEHTDEAADAGVGELFYEPANTIAAAPMAEVRPAEEPSAGSAEREAATRSKLELYCSPTAHREVGARLERSFESQFPSLDLVFHIDENRNCVGHVLVGRADAALISVPLSSREREQELQEHVVGHRIMVPVVHPDNPVRNIHRDDLAAILAGNLTGWGRVLGAPATIQPVCLPPAKRPDPAAQTVRFHRNAADRTVFLHSFAEILAYVSNNPHALGLVTLTSADAVRIVRPLRVNQLGATREFYEKGAWTFGDTFRTVTWDDPDEAVDAWLTFTRGEAARKLLRKTLTLPSK